MLPLAKKQEEEHKKKNSVTYAKRNSMTSMRPKILEGFGITVNIQGNSEMSPMICVIESTRHQDKFLQCSIMVLAVTTTC